MPSETKREKRNRRKGYAAKQDVLPGAPNSDYKSSNCTNWVSPSLPRCRGSAGTRWLDDGVVGRRSNSEGLLASANDGCTRGRPRRHGSVRPSPETCAGNQVQRSGVEWSPPDRRTRSLRGSEGDTHLTPYCSRATSAEKSPSRTLSRTESGDRARGRRRPGPWERQNPVPPLGDDGLGQKDLDPSSTDCGALDRFSH